MLKLKKKILQCVSINFLRLSLFNLLLNDISAVDKIQISPLKEILHSSEKIVGKSGLTLKLIYLFSLATFKNSLSWVFHNSTQMCLSVDFSFFNLILKSNVFHQFWKFLSHYILKYCICLNSLLFWNLLIITFISYSSVFPTFCLSVHCSGNFFWCNFQTRKSFFKLCLSCW